MSCTPLGSVQRATWDIAWVIAFGVLFCLMFFSALVLLKSVCCRVSFSHRSASLLSLPTGPFNEQKRLSRVSFFSPAGTLSIRPFSVLGWWRDLGAVVSWFCTLCYRSRQYFFSSMSSKSWVSRSVCWSDSWLSVVSMLWVSWVVRLG